MFSSLIHDGIIRESDNHHPARDAPIDIDKNNNNIDKLKTIYMLLNVIQFTYGQKYILCLVSLFTSHFQDNEKQNVNDNLH